MSNALLLANKYSRPPPHNHPALFVIQRPSKYSIPRRSPYNTPSTGLQATLAVLTRPSPMPHQSPRCLVRGSISQHPKPPPTLYIPLNRKGSTQTSMNSSMVRPMPAYPSLDARVPSTEETVVSACSRRRRPPRTDHLVHEIRASRWREGGQSSRGDRARRRSRELRRRRRRGRRVGRPGFRGLWRLDG